MKVSKKILCAAVFAVTAIAGVSAKKLATPRVEIVDSKGAAFGQDTPKWVSAAIDSNYSALEKEKELEGNVIFIAESQGKNLELLKAWVRNFEVSGNFSQALSNTVIAKAGANLEGQVDKEQSERFLKEIVATFSKTSFSGLELKKDYWVKKRIYKDKKNYEEIYDYIVVYGIDKGELKNQVSAALNGMHAETADQKRIREETLSLMDEVQSVAQSY